MPLLPAQIEGARFLAARPTALLADQMGFGKTAQAIHACDLVGAHNILIVTTASARANWRAEFALWGSGWRSTQVVLGTAERIRDDAELVVVGWSALTASAIVGQLSRRHWDVLIADEAHYAKSLSAVRTQALFQVLAPRADRVWLLTGTPVPNSPADLWPALMTLAPDLLGEYRELDAFMRRYCVTRGRMISGRWIETVIGGRNLDELAARIKPFYLRRLTEGLPSIRFGTYVVETDQTTGQTVDEQAIMAAAEADDTKALEMHLGPLRRLTGLLKARETARLLTDDLENGLDKVVVFYWHREVGDALLDGLRQYGVVRLDGETPARDRQLVVDQFQSYPDARVFLGQIKAAGEAITLTAAAHCLFAEVSFSPADMAQAVRRILRRGQTRPCLARIVALRGSLDEALMRIVARKVAMITQIVED